MERVIFMAFSMDGFGAWAVNIVPEDVCRVIHSLAGSTELLA